MISIQMLGGTDIRGPSDAAARAILGQPQRMALLAYLAAARPYGFQRRDTILALFWPDSDEQRARLGLRQVVHHIRKSLGDAAIISRGKDEIGLGDGRVDCDVRAFESSVIAGDYEQALSIYRGDLLPGFHLTGSPSFESWVAAERARLRELASNAALKAAARSLDKGDSSAAMRYARRAVEVSPDDESILRNAMQLLDRAGDRAAATRLYEAYSTRLAREWDDSPSDETESVALSIRNRQHRTPAKPVEAADIGTVATAQQAVATPAPTIERKTRSSRIRSTIFAGIAVATGIAALLVALAPRTSADNRYSEMDRVVVFPFEVRGGAAWSYLGEGMIDLLGAKLDGAGRIHAAEARSIIRAVDENGGATDAAKARSIAKNLDGKWYVTGSVFADSSGLQLHANLYDAMNGRLITEASSSGRPRDLFGVVDELTRRLLAGAQKGPATELSRLAAQTTSSTDALKDYLQGEAELRRGHFSDAVNAFEAAVKTDSTFALAYYRLSIAMAFAGTGDQAASNYNSYAMKYGDRLSEPTRLLIEANAASMKGDKDEAAQLYRRTLGIQPDNVEAWYQLADIEFHFGRTRGKSIVQSQPMFERALHYDPTHESAIVHLARIAALQGRLHDVDSLTRRVLKLSPDGDEAVEMLGVRGTLLDDSAALKKTILLLKESGAIRMWVTARRVAWLCGNPLKAVPLYELVIDDAVPFDARAEGHLGLAGIYAGAGRWQLARAHMRTAIALDQARSRGMVAAMAASPFVPLSAADLRAWRSAILQPRSEHQEESDTHRALPPPNDQSPIKRSFTVGVIDARLGNFGSALAIADSMDAQLLREENPERTARDARMLRAVVWRFSNGLAPQTERAATEVASTWETGGPFAGSGALNFLHGEISARLNRDDAEQAYRLAIEDEYGGTVYRASAPYRLAQFAEKKSRPAQAAEFYAMVYERWKQADPALMPFVRVARSRLAVASSR